MKYLIICTAVHVCECVVVRKRIAAVINIFEEIFEYKIYNIIMIIIDKCWIGKLDLAFVFC